MRSRLSILKILLLLVALTGSGSKIFAATPPISTLTGTVIEKDGGAPVYMCTVVAKESGLWAVTDEKGRFSIERVPGKETTVEVMLLGYETWTRKIRLSPEGTTLRIELSAESLSLDAVVVTAKEGGEIATTSKISAQTLEHIQPSSLKDVMQLLPGSITSNPSLTTANVLSIRDIGTNAANASGTALVVDGASVSNDSNLQMLSTGTVMGSSSSNVSSTAGSGVDARSVPTDNIESVEIIRGIPSVIYGDLTSGAVVVKTRSGITPWTVRLKTDPCLKQVAFGKGIGLGEKKGIINFDADYASAASDVRTPASAYHRFTFQGGWSVNPMENLTLTTKLRAHYSNATDASDPDLVLDELSQSRDMGLRLNVSLRWLLRKSWITDLEYIGSGSISSQYSRERKYQGSAGYTASTVAMEPGEHEGFFTLPQYYSDVTVNGLPCDGQSKLTARLMTGIGPVRSKTILGGEWKIQGNSGTGKSFDPLCPPSPGSTAAFRERSFRDIPYINRFTGFAEEDLEIPIWKTSLEVRTGIRANALSARGIQTGAFNSLEPRATVKYHLVKQNTGLRDLSIRAGRGVTAKMPSMIYLYPEPAWKDMVSFSYNDFDANDYGLAVLTTAKEETANQELKLQRSVNTEIAIEFEAGKTSGSLVYYNEDMSGGYGFENRFVPVEWRRWGYSWNGDTPVQSPLPSGALPVYDGSTVSSGGTPLSCISDTTFMAIPTPANIISTKKQGVELTLDFPRIPKLNTSVNVSGAWQRMETLNGGVSGRLYGGIRNGRTYPYVGYYAGGASSSNSTLRDRLSTNVRLITHIPKIAMVITLTAQMVFFESVTYRSEYEGLSLPYYYDGNGNKVIGDAGLTDVTHTKYINPLWIMDRKGNIIPFTQKMERDASYRDLILSTNTATYYLRGSYPFYAMFNIRMTKEVKGATISFYANNFLDMKGRVLNSVTRYPSDRNTPLYFGAEVKLTIK